MERGRRGRARLAAGPIADGSDLGGCCATRRASATSRLLGLARTRAHMAERARLGAFPSRARWRARWRTWRWLRPWRGRSALADRHRRAGARFAARSPQLHRRAGRVRRDLGGLPIDPRDSRHRAQRATFRRSAAPSRTASPILGRARDLPGVARPAVPVALRAAVEHHRHQLKDTIIWNPSRGRRHRPRVAAAERSAPRSTIASRVLTAPSS